MTISTIHRATRALATLLLTTAACTSSEAQPPKGDTTAATCARVIPPAIRAELARDLAKLPGRESDPLRRLAAQLDAVATRASTILVARCTADRWAPEVTDCYAAPDAHLAACDRRLTKAQRAANDRDLRALTAAPPAPRPSTFPQLDPDLPMACGIYEVGIHALDVCAAATPAIRDANIPAFKEAAARWHALSAADRAKLGPTCDAAYRKIKDVIKAAGC
jgi:hypothetical protein